MKTEKGIYLKDGKCRGVKELIGDISEAIINIDILIPTIVIALVLVMAARVPLDSDLWWHLRAGELTWLRKSPLMVDQFTFTLMGSRWINHSWLSEVILYGLYQWIGYPGVTLLVATLAAASIGLLYPQMEGSPLARAFLLILGAPVIALVWSPRPQMFSLLCFSILSYLLYLYKWRRRDYLWISPLLFIAWSNLHGGYPLGLMLMGLMVTGEILNYFLGQSKAETLSSQEITKLFLWLGLSALVVIINPNEASMWAVPFRTVSIQGLQDFIVEWKSPNFHEFHEQPFLWLLFTTLGAASLSRRNLDGTDLVNIVFFAYMSFLARRNFAPFGLVALPVLSRHLTNIKFEFPARARCWFQRLEFNTKISKNTSLLINGIMLFLLFAGFVLKVNYVSSRSVVALHEQEIFPHNAVKWISENHPQGNIFNSYNWGGYLIWNLPEYPVFIDGRTDLFGENLLDVYIQIIRGEDRWEEILESYEVNLILIETETTLGKVLKSSDSWQLVYKDGLAEIYVRTKPKISS